MAARDSAFGFPFTVDPGMVRTTDAQAMPGSNQAVYSRVRDAGPVSKIGLVVGTSSGNVSVAVYRNSGRGRLAAPLTRLATSGAIACPAAGYAEIALTSAVYVHQGDWLAISADNTSATFNSLLNAWEDNNLGKGRQYRQASSGHPLPATVGTLTATRGLTVVLIGVP